MKKLKDISRKLLGKKKVEPAFTNPEKGVSRFVCKSELGELIFWDTHKAPRNYYPESVSANELNETKGDPYDFRDIQFSDGDVVLDIGAHVGTVAIYLAKKHPNIKVYAFEPAPQNFSCLQDNIRENNLNNIIAINKAVTQDGRDISFTVRKSAGQSQTAHMSSSKLHKTKDQLHELEEMALESVELDSFLEKEGVKKLALLKIDCEGAEYEVLYNFNAWEKVQHVRGELHSSQEENDALVKHLKEHADLNSIRFTRNPHGEQNLKGYPYYPLETKKST